MLTKVKRSRQIGITEEEEIVNLFQQGFGINQIGDKKHRCIVKIKDILVKRNLYKPGIRKGNYRATPYTDEVNADIVYLYVNELWTSNRIGFKYKVSSSVILTRLRNLGVRIRSQREAGSMRKKEYDEMREGQGDYELIVNYSEKMKSSCESGKIIGRGRDYTRNRLKWMGLLHTLSENARLGNMRRNRKRFPSYIPNFSQKPNRSIPDHIRTEIQNHFPYIRQTIAGRLKTSTIAKAMLREGQSFEDIIDNVSSYVVEAARTYDPSKGTSLRTHVINCCYFRFLDSFHRKGDIPEKAESYDAEDSESLIDTAKILPEFSFQSIDWNDIKKRLYLRAADYLLTDKYGRNGRIMFAILVDRIIPECEDREITPLKHICIRFNLAEATIYEVKRDFFKDTEFLKIIAEAIGDKSLQLAA